MLKRLCRILLLVAVLIGTHGAPYTGSWLSEAEAATITLPETGQTGCWDTAGAPRACAGTGEDGDKLKGAAWPAPRFVDQGNGTVRDDLTGLVWLQNGNCFGTRSWTNALSDANTLLGNNTTCSLTDSSTAGTWRLPNRKELLSLANYQQANCATWLNLAAQKFSGVQANKYWTSDSYNGGAGSKWYVSLNYGDSYYDVAASSYYVWPVRDFSATIGSNPALKDFGNVASGATSASQTFTLSNTGLDPLVVSSISLTGADAAMFAVDTGDGTAGTCGATPTIAPAGSCTIAATFSPTSTGAKSTTLRIGSNDPATATKDLALSGTGTAVTYTVGTTVVGGGGTISCQSPVNSGANSICTISPTAGYTLATFTDDGVNKLGSVGANSYTITNVTANHAVAGTFSLNSYSVTPSAGANGSIAPAVAQTVNHGSTTAFTVTPAAGYIASVGGTCGGALVGTTYTTNAVTANCTVVASFSQNSYSVTPSAGANGSISPAVAQTVTHGSTTNFTVTPAAGYTASVGGTCGGSLVGTTYTTNAISANCTVVASFSQNSYTVTPSAGANGSIAPAVAQTVNHGSITAFTVTPAAGYTASVGGSCGGAFVGTTYTTNAITANCTVTASFVAIPPVNGVCGSSNGGTYSSAPTGNLCSTGITSPVSGSGPWSWSCTGEYGGSAANCSASIVTLTVAATAGTGGSISPSSRTVNQGTTAVFTVTPATGYKIASVTGCNGALSGNSYTTGQITGACAVAATFSLLPPPPPDPATVPLGFGIPVDGTVSAATAQTDSSGTKVTSFTFTPSSSGSSISVTVLMQPGYGLLSSSNGSITGSTFVSGSLTGSITITFTSVTRNGHSDGSSPATLADALLVLQYVQGQGGQLTQEQLIRYDVAPLDVGMTPTGDGQVNIFDAIAILRRALGIGSW